MEDIMNSEGVSLAVIYKNLGESSQLSIVTLILSDLVKYFNVGKTMNAQQVIQTAQLIIEDYYYLKIDDFKLCFNRAKKGFYGKVYDRIDGNVILMWLDEYCVERSNSYEQEGEKISEKRKVKSEKRGNETCILPEYAMAFRG